MMEAFFVETVLPWLLSMVNTHPYFVLLVTIMGTLRLLVKPVMTILQVVVKLTPYDKDDQWLAKVEGSKAYGAFLYFLDWFASVKVGTKQ
jgi:hypothetical protein